MIEEKEKLNVVCFDNGKPTRIRVGKNDDGAYLVFYFNELDNPLMVEVDITDAVHIMANLGDIYFGEELGIIDGDKSGAGDTEEGPLN